MRLEINEKWLGDGRAIGDQVIQTGLPGVVLQLVDDCKAAVVEDKYDQLFCGQHRGEDVRIHELAAAVTDENNCTAVWFHLHLRDPCAPAAGDFIAHAGSLAGG